LELKFRQACAAELMGEAKFLNVNHCLPAKDDFGFIAKTL